MGKTDKGKAVELLKELYDIKFREINTYGIGDSQNDLAVLEAIDIPFYIKEINGKTNSQNLWEEILNQISDSARIDE